MKEAVWRVDPTKAHGYDGYNLRFVKECWNIIGKEFVQCIINFFDTSKSDPLINTTWVTLIPKVVNP